VPLPLVRVLPAFQTIVLGAAVVCLYFPVLADLVTQWQTDENYSHGFLIPLISAYLIWERRQQLLRAPTRVSVSGYFVLLLGLTLLVVGQAATFGYAARLSLLLVLAALPLFLRGPDVLRIIAFPLAYLIFMIPLPAPALNQIAFPLQVLAARVATGTLDLLNFPVLREGNIISLAAVRLEVAEACSGIRSLISLLALATIYAYLTQKMWTPRLLLILSAIPIAVIANAVRVTLTGVLAYTLGLRTAMGFYHTFAGWLIFVIAFGILALEGVFLSRAKMGASRA
jgi:exosortase